MTARRIARLRKLCDEATPGPWESAAESRGTAVFDRDRRVTICRQTVAGNQDVANAALIADARTALPALLDEVERLREQLRRSATVCPKDGCVLWKDHVEGHATAEEVSAALRSADRLAAMIEAWKTVELPDKHPPECGLKRVSLGSAGSLGMGYMIGSPCTCGLHERQRAARKLLDNGGQR